MKKTISQVVSERILILDGAMGTMIQQYNLSQGKERAVVGILLETNSYDDNLDVLVSKSLPELMQILYELQSNR